VKALRPFAPVLVLVLLCAVLGVSNPNFLDPWNLVRLLNAAAIPMVLVMGATFVILMGSIDLSVEGIVAITAVLASLLVANNLNGNDVGLLAVPAAILLGGAIGLVNGLVHVKLRIPSFMATLGVGFACIGVATAVLGGVTVRISDQTFRGLALTRLLGVPVAVWVAAVAVAAAFVFQERTRVGRWLYALGGDEETARQVGVPIGRARILVFAVAGLFYGLGGAMSAAQLGQGHALISQGRLFTTVTAVVVGGTSLSGGVGSVLNSVVGVLIVIVLANGMVLMGVPPFVQQGVQGLLIIAAVALALDRSRQDVVK
jgi:ribose transport system permease protein